MGLEMPPVANTVQYYVVASLASGKDLQAPANAPMKQEPMPKCMLIVGMESVCVWHMSGEAEMMNTLPNAHGGCTTHHSPSITQPRGIGLAGVSSASLHGATASGDLEQVEVLATRVLG